MAIDFNQILDYYFWNNSVKEYLIALGLFVLVVIVLKIFKEVIISKIKKLADHTKTEFDDLLIKMIDSVGWLFYVLLSLWVVVQFIEVPVLLNKAVAYAFLATVVYYAVRSAEKFIDYGLRKFASKKEERGGRIDSSAINVLSKLLKGVLWAVAVLIVLQNSGYNISALMAGLGIGGIAIAFALQNILGDIFASFSIYFDKPFQTGDFIIVGEEMGTVKKIGIKSTRVQTLQGEELILSNKFLTEAKVHNYKEMEKRRISFTFGVTYGTVTEKLRKIPSIVRTIIDGIEVSETDRVHFKEFGDFSLNFEVVYYLNSSDYNVYMNTQQEINLAIKDALEKEKIEMAYPTQTIFVKK